MKTKRSALPRAWARGASALVLGGALALIAGCASEPESHVVSAPPPPAPGTAAPAPVVVTTTQAVPAVAPATAAAPQPVNTVVVTQAPPVPQAEVVLARPSPDQVWVPGYWTWRDDRYEWMAGHWEIPPTRGETWVAPHWDPENGAYRFYEGYWN